MKQMTAYILGGILTLGGGAYLKSRMNLEFNLIEYLNGRDFRAELDALNGREVRTWDMSEEELEAILEEDKMQKAQRNYPEENEDGEE